MRIVLVIGLALLALGIGISPVAAAAGEPQVPLTPGMDLPAALTAVQHATGDLVVAEQPAPAFKLDKDTHTAALSDCLAHIANTGDFYLVRRGSTLVFQRCFGNGDTHGLSVPELTRIVTQLRNLQQPFGYDRKPVNHHWKFYSSLSVMQREAMKRPAGLSYLQLSTTQQQLWNRLTLQMGAGHLFQSTDRLSELFNHWSQAELVGEFVPARGLAAQERLLLQSVATGAHPTGLRFIVPLITEVPPNHVYAEDRAPLVTTLAARKTPAALAAPLPSFHGNTTLEEVYAAVKNAAGIEVRSPDIPLKRRVWLYTHDQSAGEVLQALADLYGWELAPQGSSAYYLGIYRFGSSPKLDECFSRQARTLPADCRNSWRGLGIARIRDRNLRQAQLIRPALEQLSTGWQHVAVKSLSLTTQRTLAALLLDTELSQQLRNYLDPERTPALVTQPERCIVRLEGHDTLFFRPPPGAGGPLGLGFSVRDFDRRLGN